MNPIRAHAGLALLLALVVSAAPSRAAAQDPRLAGRLPAATIETITTMLDSARTRGLPTEPLVQRALEGAGRRVDPARIVAGVRALADRMLRAREALGTRSTDNELVAGASALYLGVEPSALQRLRQTQPSGDVTLPLVVLADIVERGVPRDTATAVIATLSQARVPDESYQMLRRSILLDIGAGAPPAAAATARARALLMERPRPVPPRP